ncbi:solute carrier organic anion transporter family member 2A1-like [Tubulanus polymorphus]|uniref:solute carrier organic anion transporter family member 2A1-like n=1 Tax=Tubulanus polymorphus TaxID=672921 RepID=UPI003DA53EA4
MNNSNQHSTEGGTDGSEETECGIGRCRSEKCRPCVNVKLFTVILAIIVTFNGAAGSYLVSVITTLEKAFLINSSKSGFITTANDIGFTCAVLLITHYTSKLHKPRVLAICGFTIGVASIVCSLPYFIYGSPDSVTQLAVTRHQPSQIEFQANLSYMQPAVSEAWLCDRERMLPDGPVCDKRQAARSSYRSTGSYAIVVFGQIIIGVAMSPVWTLGLAYIDDNVSKYSAPIYIGILFSLRTLAPIMGFGLGAGIISIPIDLKSSKSPQDDDQNSIGAWWLGFLIFGICSILTSIPMAFFPKRMPPLMTSATDDDDEDDVDTDVTTGKIETVHAKRGGGGKRRRSKSFQQGVDTVNMLSSTTNSNRKLPFMDFPRALMRIFKNQVYIWAIISCTLNVFYGQGFYSFLPKYMEKLFHLRPSTANLILGVCCGIAAGLGTILGGWIVSHNKWGRLQVAKFWFIFELIGTLILYTLIFPTCEQLPVQDLTTEQSLNVMNETCNTDCSCSPVIFRPVCGGNVTYTSPCQAGCPNPGIMQDDVRYYGNCSCISDKTVSSGICSNPCLMYIPLAVLLFLKTFFMSMCAVPFITLLMRSVPPADKALGIGVLLFVSNICGIPSPVVYGAIIDGVCIHRNLCIPEICYLYDNDHLRYKYFGLAFGLRTLNLLAVFPVWFILRRSDSESERKDEQQKQLEAINYNESATEQ